MCGAGAPELLVARSRGPAADTSPLPPGPALCRRPALGAAVGAAAEAQPAEQGRGGGWGVEGRGVDGGLGSRGAGWRCPAGKVQRKTAAPPGSACGVFPRSGPGPERSPWLCVAKPLRGEQTPATQLGKTSHPFLCTPSPAKPGPPASAPSPPITPSSSAPLPRRAAQPPSASSVPRGSALPARPSPAISRGCCAEPAAAALPELLGNRCTCAGWAAAVGGGGWARGRVPAGPRAPRSCGGEGSAPCAPGAPRSRGSRAPGVRRAGVCARCARAGAGLLGRGGEAQRSPGGARGAGTPPPAPEGSGASAGGRAGAGCRRGVVTPAPESARQPGRGRIPPPSSPAPAERSGGGRGRASARGEGPPVPGAAGLPRAGGTSAPGKQRSVRPGGGSRWVGAGGEFVMRGVCSP